MKHTFTFSWLDTEPTYITDTNEWNALKNEILEKSTGEFAPIAYCRRTTMYHKHCFIKNESFAEIREYITSEEFPRRYIFSFTGCKVNTHGYGHKGYNYINEMFKVDNKISIWKAFGGPKYADLNKDIKKCVITQVDYADEKNLCKIMSNCFKSDVSSAYPYQLTKSLPTLHDCKVISGRAEPTEEYPFAFYTKSHHVKIYNELYTKNLGKKLYSRFYKAYNDDSYKWRPQDYIKAEDDETILCKKSEYSLKYIFEDIYAHRKENSDLKVYMNACIGYFHKNQAPFLSHIAAVVLARCAFEMIERANTLYNEGNTVLLINTDSIIWQGKQSNISIPANEKTIGSFAVEYENIRVCIKGIKGYQMETPTGCITRYSGAKKEESEKMKFGDIVTAENIDGLDQYLYFDTDTFEIHDRRED